jgi:type IV pilus assembly protein PilO
MTLKNLSVKYQLALIGLIAVLLLVGAYVVIWNPQWQEKQRQTEEADRLNREHERLLSIQRNIPKARADYEQLKLRLDEVLRQIPEEKEVPGLLRQVSSAAQETRTRVKYFAPKELVARDFYAELPFDIKYSGSYHGLGYFFDAVRRLERIVSITSFTLESKSTQAGKTVIEGSCVAKTYVSSKAPPPKKESEKGKEKEKGIKK